jgi:exonuclease III
MFQEIFSVYKRQNPDILCIQEFSSAVIDLKVYRYKYILMQEIKTGQAIFLFP